MSQQTWNYDAPSGVYKNHQMSEDLRFAAIAETKFMMHCKPESGYGKKKGESITITRVSNVDEPTDGRLGELQEIPEDELTLSTISITVSEWGRAIPYTSLAEDLGSFDIENIIQRKLKDQMKLTMDAAAAAAFKTGQIKAVADGVASIQFATNGTAPAQASSNLKVYHVEQIRDYMYSTLLIPPADGDNYIAFLSTKAKRGIINDPNWEKWHTYVDAEAKFVGEIGKLEGVRFIEVNHGTALEGTIGSAGVCGEAVFFGADAVAMAVALDPELRAKVPGDFGRSKAVAWYGILEFGQVWGDSANAGEARVVHFTST